ncbi:MAG: hypothetical protein UR81_C0007G0008 [Candidatus Levybacteria bacterium GW2011_GWB1_35_5]|nr:MAG: hypothetical protein UR81_C0007G0008 [Candidatus Levybacteria bacterium GW2011_GWB1_35_5]
MIIAIILVILLISFILALYSLKSLNEKPGIKEIKKSLDKERVIYRGHSSK